jgi:DNA-binding NtrC family response regulator
VIPPLRERPTEIGDLAQAFLQSAARQTGRGYEPALSYEALEVLKGYSWPGNIRELRNVVERAVLLCGPGPILPKHLPLEKIRVTFAAHPAPGPPAGAPTSAPLRAPLPLPSSSPTPTPPPLDDGDPEKQRILDALNRCAGNQTAAAKLLGMGRRTLINRLDQYGIARPRKGR